MNRKRILESDSEGEEEVQQKSRKQAEDNDSGKYLTIWNRFLLRNTSILIPFLDENHGEANGAPPAAADSSDAESGASDHEQGRAKEPVRS